MANTKLVVKALSVACPPVAYMLSGKIAKGLAALGALVGVGILFMVFAPIAAILPGGYSLLTLLPTVAVLLTYAYFALDAWHLAKKRQPEALAD